MIAERNRKTCFYSSVSLNSELFSCGGVVQFKINDISGKTIIIDLTTLENFKNRFKKSNTVNKSKVSKTLFLVLQVVCQFLVFISRLVAYVPRCIVSKVFISYEYG